MAAGPERAWKLAPAPFVHGSGTPTKHYLRQLLPDKRAFVRAQHMLHFPMRLHLQNTNPKIKLLRISRWQPWSIKYQVWNQLLSTEPSGLPQ